MTRQELITEIKKYFDIRELVCAHTFNTFGEKSWQFFDRDVLETLLVLRRDIFGVPMTINNWQKGGKFSQRGFRCNICQLVKDKTLKGLIYLTSHANGAAFDCDVNGISAEQARRKIEANKDKLPCNIRVEGGVSWLHFDIYDTGIKFYQFNP